MVGIVLNGEPEQLEEVSVYDEIAEIPHDAPTR